MQALGRRYEDWRSQELPFAFLQYRWLKAKLPEDPEFLRKLAKYIKAA